MNEILLDSNILIYSVDPRDVSKQDRAIAVLAALQATKKGCLSVQCLSEFSAVCIRSMKALLTPEEAEHQVRRLGQSFTAFPLTEAIVEEALRGVRIYQFSYYDAQIWAAARLHKIPVVFSEDFNPGVYENVRIINPFDSTFNLQEWA